MSHTVNLEISTGDFRQNFTPTPAFDATARHWMLDFEPARDLLKAALRRTEPNTDVAFWGPVPELDAKLNCMIDVVGLRDAALPVNNVEQFRATVKFFFLMLRFQFGFNRTAA